MSDLSRLLDDVYGTTTTAPSWTPETAEVFADCVPDAGPDVQAHLAIVPDPVEALEAIFDLGLAGRTSSPEPVAAPAPSASGRPWVPSDDDILPPRAPRRWLPFRVR